MVCFFGFITSINYALSLDLSTFLLTAYCFLFSGILFLFELHTKRIGDRFRVEYGFLFTYIGRCLYIFLYALCPFVSVAYRRYCSLFPH